MIPNSPRCATNHQPVGSGGPRRCCSTYVSLQGGHPDRWRRTAWGILLLSSFSRTPSASASAELPSPAKEAGQDRPFEAASLHTPPPSAIAPELVRHGLQHRPLCGTKTSKRWPPGKPAQRTLTRVITPAPCWRRAPAAARRNNLAAAGGSSMGTLADRPMSARRIQAQRAEWAAQPLTGAAAAGGR